jgi:peptidoglycan hydrolase-like protein with peptidoglycan-binding domain
VKLKRPLYGPDHAQGPSRGSDVVAVKRGLSKVEDDFFPRPANGFDDAYNAKTVDAVKVFQKLNGIKATGHFGQATLNALEPYMDARAKALYARFELPPEKAKIVEPNQGFDSLHSSLWEAYSIGRNMGLSDLGTYNPASRLPSGSPSDHAVYPALAFDLGIEPDTGYSNPTGRAFFDRMIGRQEVSYVILGDKIWSRALGLHAYTAGGHLNHAHVSGVR